MSAPKAIVLLFLLSTGPFALAEEGCVTEGTCSEGDGSIMLQRKAGVAGVVVSKKNVDMDLVKTKGKARTYKSPGWQPPMPTHLPSEQPPMPTHLPPIHCGDDQMMCPGPPPADCEGAACHTANTCMPITFTETVGDCRYDSDGHGNYQTIEKKSLQACLDACADDFRCHAVDTSSDFGESNTCWLFANEAGDHTGDGAESSRCYIKEPVCPPPANTGFTEVFTANTCMPITFTETVGDCRYDSGHGNYQTIEKKSLQACLDACADDFRCHAVDTPSDFGESNTCWLFANEAGDHTGDGVESSRCYIKGQSC